MFSLITAALVIGQGLTANALACRQEAQAAPGGMIRENRTLDQIHAAALKEGGGRGTVVLWHGGDEKDQMDFIKKAFETRFKNMTLNLTVDLSKYHDGRVDRQLAEKKVTVDSVMLQTVHDFPRWAKQGALLNYAPLGWDKIDPELKDASSAYWYGLEFLSWHSVANTKKAGNVSLTRFADYIKPEFKDKLVLTYPNDDDAVLYAFDLIVQKLGVQWFEKLLAQKPTWVRGTATPLTMMMKGDNKLAASFTTTPGAFGMNGTTSVFPEDADWVSWAQRGAIMKDAPHKEGAKLLHSFMLDPEFQRSTYGWSVRTDVKPADGLPDRKSLKNTNTPRFNKWMEDRANVERLRFWYEDRIGAAQGKSPLEDGI